MKIEDRILDDAGAVSAANGRTEETEKALAASELRYRRLFESAKDGILILDADSGMVVDANPFLTDLLGFSREEFLGKRVWELGYFKHLAANAEKFAELQAKEYVRYENLPLETFDGRIREVEFISNVYLAGGKRVIQCNIRDITERKQMEAFRELSREILQILNEPGDTKGHLPQVLALLKIKSGFDAVSIRLQDGDHFSSEAQTTDNSFAGSEVNGGWSRDEVARDFLEKTCRLVLSGKTDPAKALFTRGGSAWTNDTRLVLDSLCGSGARQNRGLHHGFASVALVPIRNQDRIAGLLQFNDRHKNRFTLEIMEILEVIATHIGSALMRTRAEQALMMKTMLLEAQKEASPDGILALDNENRVLLCNTRFAEIWRIPREVMDTDDSLVMLEYALTQLQDPEEYQRTVARLHQHEQEQIRDEIHFLDGRCFEVNTSPLQDAEGGNRGRFWFFRDVSERKRAADEESKLSEQLRHAQKMEAVGQLAGGVAHDFNNLLMGIMGYADICRDEVAPGHPVRQWLDEITKTAERSAKITRQLLSFARKQPIAPKVLDLNDALSGMLNLLRRMIGEDVKLIWRPGANLKPVRIDPSQMDQILTNLCVNARDVIEGVGEIVIETGRAVIDADYCAVHADALPGSYVCLSVSDDGSGMDKETLAQIFDPFFTTKEQGKGTGLGLATVYGIVKQNNGFVYAYSEPGTGTTFKIYFPEVQAAEAVNDRVEVEANAPGGRGVTILLVEDEEPVRMICGRILEGLGYRVLSAETPEAALKITSAYPGTIDVLVTDVVMPGMDGRQLAKQITDSKPLIKTLFISGYTADVIAQRGVLDKGVNFLSKPFTRDSLARKIHEVLDS